MSDLLLWLHPALGTLTDSTNLSNGLHIIEAEFIDSTGHLIETSNSVTIRVDNRQCIAALATPTLNGNPADPNCGLLHYTGVTSMPVSMPLTATHPQFRDLFVRSRQRRQWDHRRWSPCACRFAAHKPSLDPARKLHNRSLRRVPLCSRYSEQWVVQTKSI